MLSQSQPYRSEDTKNVCNNVIRTNIGCFISDHIFVVIHSPIRNICVVKNWNNEEFLDGRN